MIKTIPITESQILTRDIFWMLAFAAAIIPLILIPKRHEITRSKGFILVVGYGMFIFLVFTS